MANNRFVVNVGDTIPASDLDAGDFVVSQSGDICMIVSTAGINLLVDSYCTYGVVMSESPVLKRFRQDARFLVLSRIQGKDGGPRYLVRCTDSIKTP